MSFSTSSANSILQQIFGGTALPWNGNANLWIALYTSDPGAAGSAVTNEASFGSYARVPLARASDFTFLNNTFSNTNLEQFPEASSGPQTITHAGIVTTASGAGSLLARTAFVSAKTVETGNTLQFQTGTLVFTLATTI
jgi:hypothetical protein